MTESRFLHEGDGPFGDLQPGRPPAELRTRVLTAAAEALSREPDFWNRLWFSRAVRVGWAVAVSLLIAGHLALTPLTTKTPEVTGGDMAFSMTSLDSELEEIVRLPRIDQAALAGPF